MRIIDKAVERRQEISSQLSHSQKVIVALNLQSLVKRQWFASFIDPAPEHGLRVLLLVVYAYCLVGGSSLSKRNTWQLMQGEDIKTARKHMMQAQQLGLIKISTSKKDKRVDLIEPTDLLNFIVEQELMSFFDEMRTMLHQLLEHPLPQTLAPTLRRGAKKTPK